MFRRHLLDLQACRPYQSILSEWVPKKASWHLGSRLRCFGISSPCCVNSGDHRNGARSDGINWCGGQAVIDYLHKPVPSESQDGTMGPARVAPGEVRRRPTLEDCLI